MEGLTKGKKIEIEGDYFIVGQTEIEGSKKIIKLLTRDEEIIDSFLKLKGEKIFFCVQRKIKEKINGKGIEYKKDKFQIIEKTWKREKRKEGWKRYKEYILEKINSKKEEKAKILEENDRKIFVFCKKIQESDLSFNISQEEDNKINLPKKIKIKYKEKI